MVKYQIKFGKLPAINDVRTFKFEMLFKRIPPVPDTCTRSLQIDNPMFANDRWGCCVIAAQAHGIRRFELFEQKKLIEITDQEVLKEYWYQGGSGWLFNRHPDNGLVLLKSINQWRKKGILISGNRYNIYAYAGLNPRDINELKASIFYLTCVPAGFALPPICIDQFNKNEVWHLDETSASIPNPHNGHAILLNGYDKELIYGVSWGTRIAMTYEFYKKCADESYAIVDNRDKFVSDSPVDVNKLDKLLHEITD